MLLLVVVVVVAGVFQRDREHTHERRRRRRLQDVPLPGRHAAPVRHAEGRLPALRQPRLAQRRPAGLRHRQRAPRRHGLDRRQARIRRLPRHAAARRRHLTVHVRLHARPTHVTSS